MINIVNLKFKEEAGARGTRFLGRNGYYKCHGVSVSFENHAEIVSIEPFTSKGTIGRCGIEIPAEAIKAVVCALMSFAPDSPVEICAECGESVKWGSGRFVNRVPIADDLIEEKVDSGRPYPHGDFVCHECDSIRDSES